MVPTALRPSSYRRLVRQLVVVSPSRGLTDSRVIRDGAARAILSPGRAWYPRGTPPTMPSIPRLGCRLIDRLHGQSYAGRLIFSPIRKITTTKAGASAHALPTPEDNSLRHVPPLPVRVAQVAAATAIATPAFPAIAFCNLTLRVMLPDPVTRTLLQQNVSTVLSLAAWTILPWSYNVAPILLPFALANGATAGAGYLVLDFTSTAFPQQKEWLMQHPLIAGGGIGAFTGLVAPLYLYGPAYHALYGVSGLSEQFFVPLFWYTPLVAQISVATGVVAGLALYPLLYYPILGVRGMHWGNLSGLVLLTSALTMVYLYDSTTARDDLLMYGVYKGSFVPANKVPLLDSMVRYRIASGALETWSWSQAAWVGPGAVPYQEGQALVTQARKYHKKYGTSAVTMDDQILTLLNTWVDDRLYERFPRHVVAVPAPAANAKHADLLQTDLVLAHMMPISGHHSDQAEESDKFAGQLQQLGEYSSMLSAREFRTLCRSSKDLSVAVQLFFLLRSQTNLERLVPIERVEAWIRRRAPGLFLLRTDEPMGGEGQSIESQLRESLGNRKPSALLLPDALEEWHRLLDKEQRLTRQQQVFAVAGTVLAALSFFLMASTSGG